MKLFSCFDTKLKQSYIDRAYIKYGPEEVIVITRDRLYFFLKVIIRALLGLLIQVSIMILTYYMSGYTSMVSYGLPIGFIISLIFYGIALENYIDYSMNYAIFTSHEATLVEQN